MGTAESVGEWCGLTTPTSILVRYDITCGTFGEKMTPLHTYNISTWFLTKRKEFISELQIWSDRQTFDPSRTCIEKPARGLQKPCQPFEVLEVHRQHHCQNAAFTADRGCCSGDRRKVMPHHTGLWSASSACLHRHLSNSVNHLPTTLPCRGWVENVCTSLYHAPPSQEVLKRISYPNPMMSLMHPHVQRWLFAEGMKDPHALKSYLLDGTKRPTWKFLETSIQGVNFNPLAHERNGVMRRPKREEMSRGRALTAQAVVEAVQEQVANRK